MSVRRENAQRREDFQEQLNQAKLQLELAKDPFSHITQKPLHSRFREYIKEKINEVKLTMPIMEDTVIILRKSKRK